MHPGNIATDGTVADCGRGLSDTLSADGPRRAERARLYYGVFLMLPLLFLSSLMFDGDVTRLGDRDYATREAAFVRLKAVGWWASVAIHRTDGESIEAGERLGRLRDALPRVDRMLVRWAGSTPDSHLCRIAPPVCKWIEQHGGCAPRPGGGVPCGDLWKWCQMQNYISGSVAGDFAIVVECWTIRNRESRGQ